jgi:hypothetical protein
VDLAGLDEDTVVLHDVSCEGNSQTLRLRKGDIGGVLGDSEDAFRAPD